MSYFIAITAGPVCSPNPATSGQAFSFTWTVKNTGDAPAIAGDDPFRKGFYVGYRLTNQYGRSVAEDAPFFDSLAPGESAGNTQTVSLDMPGEYTLTLYADPSENVGGMTGNGQGDTAATTVEITP